jgi:hypothetical protein
MDLVSRSFAPRFGRYVQRDLARRHEHQRTGERGKIKICVEVEQGKIKGNGAAVTQSESAQGVMAPHPTWRFIQQSTVFLFVQRVRSFDARWTATECERQGR